MADDDDEARFVARLRRRDEAAFNALVRRHEASIYRLLLRLVGDPADAEELAQEVFVAAFKAIDRFRGDSRLSTWLYRVAVNHAKNRQKYLARRATLAHRPHDEAFHRANPGEMPTTGAIPGPEAAAVGRQAEDHVRAALAALDEEQRTLLVLRDVEGLSYDAIREVTGLAEGTVKSRLHRARAALAARYRARVGERDDDR